MHDAIEVLKVMLCVLLCMPEAVEVELCLLEVLKVIRCMLLYNSRGREGSTLCAAGGCPRSWGDSLGQKAFTRW